MYRWYGRHRDRCGNNIAGATESSGPQLPAQNEPVLTTPPEPAGPAPITSPGDTSPSQQTPGGSGSSLFVTFADGSSGYFTPAQVAAMAEAGEPIVSVD